MLNRKPRVFTFAAVLCLCLSFALITGHIWEDYWITFRASKNLATGQGLVFTPGERLHTFTSPLGTLIPAALSWLTGNRSDSAVIWLFRLASASALAGGIVLIYEILSKLQRQRTALYVTLGLIAMDAKTVDFAINGMETGMVIFFLALTLHGLLVNGRRQWLRLGFGWAGLMWSRPDSCAYIFFLMCGMLIFPPRASVPNRKSLLRLFMFSGALCALLYLPWILWAWWYYGSPVPHTIIAKSSLVSALTLNEIAWKFLLFPMQLIAEFSSLQWTFLPAYCGSHEGWFAGLYAICGVAGIVCAFAWLLPSLRRETRMLSLTFYLSQFFLSQIVRLWYPWYLPAIAVLGYIAIGLILDQALSTAQKRADASALQHSRRYIPALLRTSAILVLAGQFIVTVCVARQVQVQQDLVENGVRREIGLWLREHARNAHDTVLLEPLGYIGYFSGLKTFDWPGLSSREMVAVRRKLGLIRENRAFLELKPDWMVLRPDEIDSPTLIDPARLNEFYEVAATFDATEKINAVRWLPGKGMLQTDQKFVVFRRKPELNAQSILNGPTTPAHND